jgi:hypothetical protein
MSDKKFAVILLHATSHALRAEKLLSKQGIGVRLIPVPRHISSDCGVCIRVQQDDSETALEILEGNRVETDGIHNV